MAKNNIGLVYGGAKVGLMGTIADAVLNNNGYVCGIIPRSIHEEFNLVHKQLNEIIVTEGLDERVKLMIERSNAFIALPGGIGTIEEIFRIMTLNSLSLIKKPLVILNTDGFYDELLKFIDHIVSSKYVKDETIKAILRIAQNVDEALQMALRPATSAPKKLDLNLV